MGQVQSCCLADQPPFTAQSSRQMQQVHHWSQRQYILLQAIHVVPCQRKEILPESPPHDHLIVAVSARSLANHIDAIPAHQVGSRRGYMP